MNANEAKALREKEHSANINAWAVRAIARADEKIRLYAAKGKGSCDVDLKFPPDRPNDETSEEVATEVKRILAEERGFTVRIRQKINHDGAILEIIW
jgi:hypothetical protein